MTAPLTSQAFQGAASKPVAEARSFSIWLNAHERAFLEAQAGDAPLGAYIKSKALTDAPFNRRRRGTVADEKALAKVLALLGRSRIANNLNQLAKAANIGTLPLTSDVVEDIEEACRSVSEIRQLLIHALGLKP